jgi:hypothetical protein
MNYEIVKRNINIDLNHDNYYPIGSDYNKIIYYYKQNNLYFFYEDLIQGYVLLSTFKDNDILDIILNLPSFLYYRKDNDNIKYNIKGSIHYDIPNLPNKP